ncbi:MAG: ComEC/Rec2 family competence protein, partial [Clostridia bacterium]|nr:ComEC/Rec2 family competence protein [Clostridia bacterium]
MGDILAQRKGFTVKSTSIERENYPIFGAHFSSFIGTCRPLVGVAVTGFLTVLIGFYRPETLPALTVIFTAVLLLSLFFRRFRRIIIPLFMVLLIAVSCLVTVGHIRRLQPLDRQTATVTFTVAEEPYHSGVGKRMTVRVAESRLFEGFKATVWYRQGDFKVGGRYRAEITFYSVEQSKYRMSNYGNGTFLNGVLHSAAQKTGESRPLVLAGKVRHYVRQTLTRRFTPSQAATLCALTVGDRSDFSDDFYNAVRDAGVSHVMVVSGLHLGIVFGGLFHLLQKFTTNRTVQAVVALFGVLFFMAVCGFTMSIIRAGITYLIAAAAPLFKRDYDPVTALAATVCGVTVVSPFTVLNVAFQLSVTATFAILVVA